MELGTSELLTWMIGKFSRSESEMRAQSKTTVIVVLSLLMMSTLPMGNLPSPLHDSMEFHAYQQADNGNGTWTVEIVDDQTGGLMMQLSEVIVQRKSIQPQQSSLSVTML